MRYPKLSATLVMIGSLAKALILGFLAVGCRSDANHATPVLAETRRPAVLDDTRASAVVADAAFDLEPRMRSLVTAALECWPPGLEWQRCDAAEQITHLSFKSVDDAALAAGCSALLDHPRQRELGAICLRNLAPTTMEPHLAHLLDAFQHEHDRGGSAMPSTLEQLASAISHVAAAHAGLEPRVIELVRKLVAEGGGWDPLAGTIMFSLFDETPSRAAGDLALEFARRGYGHSQEMAFRLLPKLRDRMPEVCATMVELASAGRLRDPVMVIGDLGQACSGQLDPVVQAMVTAMEGGRYYSPEYESTEWLLSTTPLSSAQVARLLRASESLQRRAPSDLKDYAKRLVRHLREYRGQQ